MNPGNEPTDKQLAVICRLSKGTIDVESITSRKDASRIIDDLIAKKNGNGSSGYSDCREKKVVFGLAVKLIFQKFIQLNLDYKADEFWKEAQEFYQHYLHQQDQAMKLQR